MSFQQKARAFACTGLYFIFNTEPYFIGGGVVSLSNVEAAGGGVVSLDTLKVADDKVSFFEFFERAPIVAFGAPECSFWQE